MKRIRGFTLIELLVVMTIMVIMMSISVFAVKKAMQGNAQAQGANLVRTLLSSARSQAIVSGQQVGLIFYTDPNHKAQVAMSFVHRKYIQTYHNGVSPLFGNVLYTSYGNDVIYMPRDIEIATFSDGDTAHIRDNSFLYQTRCVMFDNNGQLVNLGNMAYDPDDLRSLNYQLLDPTVDPVAYSASILPVNYTPGCSSPALYIYNLNDLNDQNYTNDPVGDKMRDQWAQSHSDLMVINAYTGGIIR